jgi:opacity protein-like surface antigen
LNKTILLAAVATVAFRAAAATADPVPPPRMPAAGGANAKQSGTVRMLDWDDGWARFTKQATAAHVAIQGERWSKLPDTAKEAILRMEFQTLQEHGIGSSAPSPGGSVSTVGAASPPPR